MKKYTLVDRKISLGYVAYRVQALRDFGNIKEGDKGGYVQSSYNLSHDGNCWIYYDITICGNSIVQDNAIVKGTGHIYDKCRIGGGSILHLNRQLLDTRKYITLDHGYWIIKERNEHKSLISSTLETIEI